LGSTKTRKRKNFESRGGRGGQGTIKNLCKPIVGVGWGGCGGFVWGGGGGGGGGGGWGGGVANKRRVMLIKNGESEYPSKKRNFGKGEYSRGKVKRRGDLG